MPPPGLISNPRRRHRLLAGLALAIGVAVVVVLVIGSGASPHASTPTAAATAGATMVQRRNLVATDTESGTLSYTGAQTIYDRLNGTITWLPAVGALIKPGGTLFRVDGEPVILMDGSTPAYRDLSPADASGIDVLELNRNLVRLGFNADGITVDDVWQPGTTAGVELLQESAGEPETGTLTLGQVVFLPGPQLVSAVDGTLGATSGGSAGSGSSTSLAVTDPAPQFVSLTTSTATPPPTTTTTSTSPTTTPRRRRPPAPTSAASGPTLAALSALLRAETAQLKAEAAELKADRRSASASTPASHSSSASQGSSSSGSDSASDGASAAPATAILQTTSTRLVVTVDLAASSQSEARVGERVTVEMPAGNTIGGRITAVSSVAQSSSSGNGTGAGSGGGSSAGSGPGAGGSSGASSTIPVTIALNGRHTGAGLDQAAVSVNFVQQRATNVLSVPVTALLATSGGSYDIQEAAAPHRLIPVTTGLFAAGYVQVSGPGVYPGLAVTDSQG